MPRSALGGGIGILLMAGAAVSAGPGAFAGGGAYAGAPYRDWVYQGGPQRIPGRVECAYYDLGGEGVAYHTADTKNHGSGMLNPANGSYLNEFRMNEAVGTSYTKFHDAIDNNPFNHVQPAEGQLYVGWTSPGEWFNLTVNVAHDGVYAADLLYTSNRGGDVEVDTDGRVPGAVIHILSTRDPADPIAWRQWHHWNIMKEACRVPLTKGIHVLTVHIVSEGNMNLAYLEFRESN